MSYVKIAGNKTVELCLSWRPASNGEVPEGAVAAGDGCYVARAKIDDEWTPAKLVDGHTAAYAPYDGEEKSCENYEVLVCSELGSFGRGFHWSPAEDGVVPKRALLAGVDKGAPLYIAKGEVNGELCVGKIHPDHQCAYFPYGGAEHKMQQYEVLVMN